MTRITIEVTGLRELQRALKEADAGLPKLIRVALNQASELVINYAKPHVPKRTGKAAASLKVRSTAKLARIAAGGRAAPYYPWLDFGGKVGRGKSVDRPFYTEGRYIYPALRKNREEITAVMSTALTELARTAGMDVT
jgi:hypothetical protein